MSVALGGTVGDDAWNRAHRLETPLQRADRDFAELLQELRVAQIGASILFGFLLALSLVDRFTTGTAFERGLYVFALVASTTTVALFVAPAAVHRLLFQRGRKRELVRVAHRMATGGLAGLALAVPAGLLLVLDVVLGLELALAVVAVLTVGIVALGVGVPVYLRRG